jgi:hypothetical protein
VSWDLFSSSAEGRNEALARAVAARRADGPARAEPTGREEWTVSALNAALRETVESVFPALWVVGEVTGFTRARSGHCYFTLRDEDAQIRCVMWRDEARRLPTNPEEGMEVRALGRISFYPVRGELQLVVSSLEGRGEGLWKLALERLRAKLEAEGLTSPARKRPSRDTRRRSGWSPPRAERCCTTSSTLCGGALRGPGSSCAGAGCRGRERQTTSPARSAPSVREGSPTF